MRITAIKEDSNGFKLIAFQSIWNNKKSKPDYSTTSFADFYPGTGQLRFFNYNDSVSFQFNNFKEALKYILNS